jgi:hypothetical protein
MGGRGAPDDLEQGADTQAWLAVSQDPKARVTGEYFHHRQRRKVAAAEHDVAVQDRLLAYLHALSGAALP